MKIHTVLAIALGASLSVGAQGTTNTPAASTNVIAIYLVTNQLAAHLLGKRQATPDEFAGRLLGKLKASLDDLKPETTPILTDADFVACDLKKDEFVITPRAAIRFGIAISDREIPYVLVAEGQRIYLGMFYSHVSTETRGSGLPGTFPDMVLVDCFMGVENIPEEAYAAMRTTNVVMTIPTLGDPRIAAAAKKLFGKGKH
jgi:hypothetical protein